MDEKERKAIEVLRKKPDKTEKETERYKNLRGNSSRRRCTSARAGRIKRLFRAEACAILGRRPHCGTVPGQRGLYGTANSGKLRCAEFCCG